MEAREFLSQAWQLEQQVQCKLMQLEKLNALACAVGGMQTGEQVSHSRNVSGMENTVIRIVEAREALDAEIDQLFAKKQEIAAVIAQVRNITLRMILEQRYLAFAEWEKIAVNLHYSQRHILARHRQALEIVQCILDRAGRGKE